MEETCNVALIIIHKPLAEENTLPHNLMEDLTTKVAEDDDMMTIKNNYWNASIYKVEIRTEILTSGRIF
jgi:hypothetical protein